MILTLLSWGIMLLLSFVLGGGFLKIVAPNIYDREETDFYIVCGLMVLCVYAQAYSLFAGVSNIAFFLIILLAFLSVFFCIKKLCKYIMEFMLHIALWKLCVFIIAVAYIGLWTLKAPTIVDTYLYHAQALRWIEEYGVVPGLGNLHNRFAYNSAFMPLQALFSFSWIYSASMHSLNGFICTFFLVYAITTNKLLISKTGGYRIS